MNTKTTKFLAVLAVFAMAFASFAVVAAGDDGDATISYDEKVGEFEISNSAAAADKVVLSIMGQTTLNAVIGSKSTVVTGYTMNTRDAEGTAYSAAKWAGISVLRIAVPAMSQTSIGGISFMQKSSMVEMFADADMNSNQVLDKAAGTMTSWFAKETFTNADSFEFLVPQDGTGVELTVTIYGTEGFDATQHTGTAIGSTTYSIDLSGVTTVVDLSNGTSVANPIGASAEGGWAYTGDSGDSNTADVLTLNNFEGQVAFIGKITTVSLIGENELEVDLKDSSASATAAQTEVISGYLNAALSSRQAMTVKTATTATPASLEIENKGTGFGIGVVSSSLTIGDISGETGKLNTDLEVFAGDRAIYAESDITIDNASVTACGSERAIHTYNGNMTISGGSDVVAFLEGDYLNDAGDDDIFAIKVAKNKNGGLTISEGSTVFTQGLRVYGTIAMNQDSNAVDRLYISGGYEQNPEAESKMDLKIAGFYADTHATALTITKVAEADVEKDAAGIYFIGDVDYYTKCDVTITDKISGKTEVQKTINDASASAEAIKTIVDAAAGGDVIINVTTALNNAQTGIVTKANQNLEIRTVGAGKVSATLNIGAATGNDVVLTDFQGSATFSKGSIVMNVIEWSGGDVTLSDGDVLKLSGSIVTVAAGVTITGPTTGSASILVEDGKTLEITGTLYLKNKLVMNNDGSIIGDGTIDVPAGASFYSSNPVTVNFTGDGEIILDDATEKVYLSGTYTSTNTYSATQEVIVNGNLTVMSGAYIVITGGLKVLDGVTITIQDGGMILVTSVTAYAEIAGTIKSNGTMMYKGAECPGFYVDGTVDGDVEISGSVIAAKAPTDDKTTVKISGVVELTGTLTVNIKAVAEFDKLYVTDGGELIVNGTIKGQFYNESTVTINGKVDGTTTIYMFADDATVNIVALTSGTLVITDDGAYLGKIGTEVIKVGSESNPANKIAFSEIAGVVVSENIYSYTYNNEKKFVNQTLLSGDATKATSTSVAVIGVTAGTATVAEELSLLKADMVVGSDAKLYVSGTIYADNAAAEGYELTIYGSMTVTGLVRSTEIIDSEAGINAVRFTSVLLATTFYNYTTLAAAIDAGATDLTVLGDLYVNTDTTIPAGMAVDASNSTVYIGAGLVDDTSVILTVANGGSLTAKKIDVRGSLAIENADTGIACSNIISDTYTTDDVSELYTNIITALKNAGLGDVVKITKKEGEGAVVLNKNATVAFGATLVIPASKELKIADKITLTVEGVIENKGTISAQHAFAEEATDGKSAIALSGVGTIQSSTLMAFDPYKIPGAYFEYNTLYYITTIAGAQAWIDRAEDSTIDIYGTNMAFGDVTFEGEIDEKATIKVHSNMISGTITLSDAKIVIDAGKKLDVTIAGAGGTIVFAGVASKDSTSIIETITDDDSETVLTITAGTFEENGASKLTTKNTTFDGIVMIDGAAKITLYKPSVKGVLGIASDVDIAGAANVSGVLAIDEDVKVDMKLTLTVSGTMTVGHGSEVTVKTGTELVKPSITVTGSIIAAEKDEDGAKATVTTTGTLTTGSNDYAGADAVISGDVTAAFYIVYDGTTFDGKIAETLTGLKDAGNYTEFYVLDELWFTYLYTSDKPATKIVDVTGEGDNKKITYNYQPKGLVDSVFSAWQKKVSGKLETITTATAVGGVKAVYALIDYNIYDVTIKTDAGIKSVSIDGIIMVNSLNNVFTLKDLAAGTHKVSYELKNGYSGTAVLSTSTGTILKDNSFALSGTEVTEFTFQLAGTEPTPEPEPVVPEKESEWTITTILLVILVILIAIMAVIVALRLNRS